MVKEYAWKQISNDEYVYPILGLKAALDDAMEFLAGDGILKTGTEIIVGTIQYADFDEVIPPLADDVMKKVCQQARASIYKHLKIDSRGEEWYRSYLDNVKNEELKELDEELQTTVKRWLKRYGYMPSWFRINNEKIYRWNGDKWIRK